MSKQTAEIEGKINFVTSNKIELDMHLSFGSVLNDKLLRKSYAGVGVYIVIG